VFGGEKPGVPMKIEENIQALELHMNLTGQSSVIYPALLWDSDGATLVDTGLPGQLDAIRRGIENAGVDFQSIDRIVLTHQDVDHIGGLPEIRRARGGKIEVLAHEEDKPYIEGDKPLIKDESRAPSPNDGSSARTATATAQSDLFCAPFQQGRSHPARRRAAASSRRH
jgi:glyoxylase-like metal-dependent hydrolase (beta-lactamase superfamily II)